jgi:tetratricopeptide (TPR) repeat protein
MDKIRRRARSKIRRKSAADLMERETKLVDKCQSTAVYQATTLLVFVILGFLIYSNTLKSPFVFDDRSIIEDNHHIRLTELTLKDIIAAGFKSYHHHRPVANISFALNYYFHRYNVIGYHYTNVIIHILTGIFLYLFIKNTLTTPLLRHRYERYRWIPFFAALLWLIHPVQTQSVTYIVQRMNSLTAMFYILSLLLYVKGRLAGQEQNKSWPWFAGCILSGILALGCKAIAATLPVFILLYEWYFFQDLNITRLKRYLPYAVGIFILCAFLGLWYLGTSPLEKTLSGYDQREFTLTERLLTQPRAVIYYISLLTYPHPGRLNLDHDFAISYSLIAPSTTLPCIGAVIGLIAFAFYIAKRQRLLSFCILWFFGNLVIESSVFALELVFEHRLYLPSMLVCLAIVALAWRCIKQNWLRLAVFCIAAILCCGWTYERNSVWSDPATLWKDCVAKSPEKARPHNNLGQALETQGKLDEAISHYRQSLQVKPDNAESYNNLGNVLLAQGKFDEAISHFRQALRIKPNFAEAHYNLGIRLAIQGKSDEAISHYRQALQVKPDYAKAHNNLGNALSAQGKFDEAISHYRRALEINPNLAEAHSNMGIRLTVQGKFDEAISHYRQALEINPNLTEAHYNLGIRLAVHGKFDEAISHFRQALQLKPDYAKAHNNLANVLITTGRVDEALKHFREAVRLKTDYLAPLNSMARILVTHPNPKLRDAAQAIELAERAAKLTKYQNPTILDTLSAAYAAAGQFDRAITTAQAALKLASDAQADELANHIRKRLELYRQAKP